MTPTIEEIRRTLSHQKGVYMKAKHGGNIYEFARKKGIELCTIIDFSANINPKGMSPLGEKALQEHIQGIIHYPDPDALHLINELSAYTGLGPSHICVGNGAAELLLNSVKTPHEDGRAYESVVLCEPSFSEYKESALKANLPIHSIPYERHLDEMGKRWIFSCPYEAIYQKISVLERSIVFLGHPNNPCGTLLDRERLMPIVKLCEQKGHRLIIDESFIDFIGPHMSLRDLVNTYKNVVIVHSLTKFFAIPGLRLGAIFGSKAFINSLSETIPTWSVNHLAQIYGVHALRDEKFIEESRHELKRLQDEVLSFYNNHPYWRIISPSVNYILMEWVGTKEALAYLKERLEVENILIRSCASYPTLGSNWYRIAIKSREYNRKLEEIMNNC